MQRLSLFLLVSLAGCAGGSLLGGAAYSGNTLRWSKEGGTQAAYLQDRYECLRESQKQRSRYAANQHAAGGGSSQVTDSGLFMACMAARGYVRDDAGPFAPPDGAGVLAQ